MRSAPSCVEFPKIQPPFDAICPHCLVSNASQNGGFMTEGVDILDHTQHVDDGLGQNSGNGRAADVVEDDRRFTKRLVDDERFGFKILRPFWIVRNDE